MEVAVSFVVLVALEGSSEIVSAIGMLKVRVRIAKKVARRLVKCIFAVVSLLTASVWVTG